jgi:dCTP deaminase
MPVLCDSQIRELVPIEPFADNVKRPGKVSFGVSSYGYDVRVGPLFKVFTNVPPHGGQAIVDPKNFGEDMFVTIDTRVTGRDHVIIPPNSFALAETVETIEVPRDVLAICVGKSTYARCGIIVNVTPLEPEWRGKVTIEISNTTPLPAKIYANEGIAQMVFLKADRVCATSYADKGGKYQDQVGLTLPKVD